MQKTHQNRGPRPSKHIWQNAQNLKLFQMGFTIVLESILWSHKGFIFIAHISKASCLIISPSVLTHCDFRKQVVFAKCIAWVSIMHFSSCARKGQCPSWRYCRVFRARICQAGGGFFIWNCYANFYFCKCVFLHRAGGGFFIWNCYANFYFCKCVFFCVSWKTQMRLPSFKLLRN